MRLLLGVFIAFTLIFGGCASKDKAVKKDRIVVWHWMTDRQEAFEELSKKYEDLTGIKVNFELFSPPDSYSQKILAAAQAKTLSDIFGVLGEKIDVASFIKAGHVVDLTPYLEENEAEWKSRFFTSALAVTSFEKDNAFGVTEGTYAIPIDLMNIQMVCNNKLLRQAGIQRPPQAWEEFIADLKTLKEKGIKGLVSGWAETWMIDCMVSNYAFNIMGEDKVIKTIKAEAPYTDSDWLRVFKLFEELRDSGGLASGVVTMDNKYAEQLFANEKVAFAFNGSWCVNVYQGMNPKLDYSVILPPEASDAYPMKIWGGAGSSFYVNARSFLSKEAVEFLKWLTDKEQQVFLVNKTKNLPSNRQALSGIPKELSEFADDSDSITHPNMWPFQEYPAVIEAFTKGVQSIIIGEKTAQELVEEVQRIKEKEIQRRN
ncbi:MAG: extracellular solute-binding protein [Candidatus Omnitrophica bacterium]|nr:extracellular solute-binding protein [Candidatus Omnitrophota bacterium]